MTICGSSHMPMFLGTSGSPFFEIRETNVSTGNKAFDKYRKETLERLEDEGRKFREFIARLGEAKDKAEFDQFMQELHRPTGPEVQKP